MATLSIQRQYREHALSQVMAQFGITNALAAPRITKVTVNVGLGKSLTDPKFTETAQKTLRQITGQEPILAKAKQSISSFKIRKGMDVGAVVTLRGKRMYDFLDRLVHIALPRVRDFRGIAQTAVDQQGNLTIGLREHLMFPEISAEELERVHGLEISITTTATTHDVGLALFTALGFPFKKETTK